MSCRTGFYLLSAAAAGLLSSCERSTATDPAASGAVHAVRPYFDVRGLLDAQVRQLTARHPRVAKQVSLRGGAPETVRVQELNWADELQIFYQADINKAALRGAYAIDSVALPGGAVRRSYRLRPNSQENAPVQSLTVTSLAGKPQEIEATLRQDNTLFFGQKQLRLTLQKGQLSAYGVSGVQKLVLFDTLRYRTAASVVATGQ